MNVAGADLKAECGADQLFANLEAGIEGAVHTICALTLRVLKADGDSLGSADGGRGKCVQRT